MSKSARDHASHTTVTYSRDDVLERARRLAERQGAEAVTLRRLAEELRTSRPQMARMFPDDHDLLFGLLDVVAAEMVPAGTTRVTCTVAGLPETGLPFGPTAVTVIVPE